MIELLLIKYRDAIQFVHDQTVRWMNKVINSVVTNLVTKPILRAGL